MTIVAALLGISVACYLFGVLYSPWGKDYRTERQTAAALPADEVQPTLLIILDWRECHLKLPLMAETCSSGMRDIADEHAQL